VSAHAHELRHAADASTRASSPGISPQTEQRASGKTDTHTQFFQSSVAGCASVSPQPMAVTGEPIFGGASASFTGGSVDGVESLRIQRSLNIVSGLKSG